MTAIILVLLLTLVEFMTKGWFTLLLAPVALVALPLEFVLQYLALKREHKLGHAKSLHKIRLVQLYSVLAAIVFIPGVGDTQELLLFGFVTSDYNSPLTAASSVLEVIALGSLLITTTLLLIAMFWRVRTAKKPDSDA